MPSPAEKASALARPPHVLVCTELLNRSVFMRVLAPLDVLASSGDAAVSFALERLLSPPMLQGVDVLVLQDSSSAVTLNAIEAAHDAGARVIYDYCDDLLDFPLDAPELGEYFEDPFIRRVVAEQLHAADVVTCDGDAPASLGEVGLGAVPLPWAIPSPDALPPRAEQAGVNVVGILGDASQQDDLALLMPVICAIAETHEVAFDFVGFAPDEFRGLPGVRLLNSLPDYRAHLETLARSGWLFALAPVANDRAALAMNRHLDADFGYAAVPAVYSRAAYRCSIEDGSTGLLAEGTDEWVGAVTRLLDDPALRADVGAAARAAVSGRYSLEAAVAAWRDLLGQATLTR